MHTGQNQNQIHSFLQSLIGVPAREPSPILQSGVDERLLAISAELVYAIATSRCAPDSLSSERKHSLKAMRQCLMEIGAGLVLLADHQSAQSLDGTGNVLCRSASKAKHESLKRPLARVVRRQRPKDKFLL